MIHNWNSLFEKHTQGGHKNSDISIVYGMLKKALEEKSILHALSLLNPNHALDIDIAREYVNLLVDGGKAGALLRQLEVILRNGFKHRLIPLRDLISINSNKIDPKQSPDTEFVVLGVSNQIGVFENERLLGSEINQKNIAVMMNQFCYNPYRINVGSIGLNEFDYENQIISNAYNVFGVDETRLNPKYLDLLFRSAYFKEYVHKCAHGGVRMDFKIEYMQNWLIPLPTKPEQNDIIKEIEKQKKIVEQARNNLNVISEKAINDLRNV